VARSCGLLEGVVLHAFDGKVPFGRESLKKIRALKKIYGLDLTSADSHLLVEAARRRTVTRDGLRAPRAAP